MMLIAVGVGTSLFLSKSVQFHRNLIVLWNPFSFVVHHTQIILGRGISLFRKRFPSTQSGCVVSFFICIPTLL